MQNVYPFIQTQNDIMDASELEDAWLFIPGVCKT